jgi:intein/homing endonuclease
MYTEEQLRELIICKRDPVYFVDKYCFIIHPVRGIIPFNLYKFQHRVLHDLKNKRFNIMLKSRQMGMSTLTAAYCLWLALFHRDKNILILSITDRESTRFLDKVKVAFKQLPDWMRGEAIKQNEHTLVVESGSIISSISSSETAGRSEALSLLVIDEGAFIKHIEKIYTSAYPTLSCVTGDTMILTQNGFRRIDDWCKNKDTGDYFSINNLSVWGKNGIEPASHGYVSPESDTLIITTKHGLQLEVTEKHPLYKLKSTGGEMTQAQKLKQGDALRIDINMNTFGNFSGFYEDFAYILGGISAEGWVIDTKRNKTIWVSNTDKEFREVFLTNTIIKPFKEDKSTPTKLRCCSTELVQYIKSLGVDPLWKCDTKQIPYKIFECTKPLIASYLSGLFDGNGCVTEKGIILSSTSRKLLSETQLLLLNFGIISSLSKIDTNKISQGKEIQNIRDSFILIIPRAYYSKFAIDIGFRISRKQSKLVQLSSKYLQNGDKIKNISTIPINEYFWDEIITIKKSTNKTYDLTVPNTHSFLQNGILGSNTGGQCIIISTPSGVGGFFHKTWMGAQSKDNIFNPILLHWKEHPERDEQWYEDQKKQLGDPRRVAQELDCEFLASGATVISGDMLKMLVETIPYSTKNSYLGIEHLIIYESPNKDKKYVIGADVATGGNKDYSAFVVIDRVSGKIVCDFKAKLPIEEFARILIRIGNYYNTALLGIENNTGYGLLAIKKVLETGYPNIYQTLDMGSGKVRKTLGWTTSVKTRPYMIQELVEAINMYHIGITNRRLVDELVTFIWNNDKAEAMTGYNDDLVIATCIGWQMRKFASSDVMSLEPIILDPENSQYNINEQYQWLLKG